MNIITASKVRKKGKKIHRKCHYEMVMYVKEQQRTLHFGKNKRETGERVGGFKVDLFHTFLVK